MTNEAADAGGITYHNRYDVFCVMYIPGNYEPQHEGQCLICNPTGRTTS